MTSILAIEQRLDAIVVAAAATPATDAAELMRLGEQTLECWVRAKALVPTEDTREGFRLLALHRQGASGDASFNACRETCRELVYHFNLVSQHTKEQLDTAPALKMMALVANHLCLFVSGKMQTAAIGDFCCSSAPLHQQTTEIPETKNA